MDLIGLQEDDLSGYIPCEFCGRLVLFDENELILHQTECRPDIACGIDLTEDEVQAQFFAFETFANEKSTTNSPEIPSTSELSQQNTLPSANTVVPKLEVEETTQHKDNKDEFNFDDHFVIPEDDIIQDNKTTFTFGSSKKEKQEEEDKPSFKAPPNPILNIDSKQLFHNQLTESDNEDTESLEDFWKRADIKLSQRLRMIENKTTDRKV